MAARSRVPRLAVLLALLLRSSLDVRSFAGQVKAVQRQASRLFRHAAAADGLAKLELEQTDVGEKIVTATTALEEATAALAALKTRREELAQDVPKAKAAAVEELKQELMSKAESGDEAGLEDIALSLARLSGPIVMDKVPQGTWTKKIGAGQVREASITMEAFEADSAKGKDSEGTLTTRWTADSPNSFIAKHLEYTTDGFFGLMSETRPLAEDPSAATFVEFLYVDDTVRVQLMSEIDPNSSAPWGEKWLFVYKKTSESTSLPEYSPFG
eukprot:CAMPEP_0197659852 /NCGR_PEP_ID=MMETSP1338-20131121/49404_1 /TAXON_ID=43686 ORGANISM="Pelagodinium beii, Strain RCC1491" /NCGR_SAMPLE_ID=MMETSP1338 /ASSEMBLY_ACC=CAM_ASM_000754 /LENGTH=270 /DNA_ID=CAMNT_0043236985 /DNA_START=21 /DNA_END=833 /DNA_ORIENTATION=-